RNYTVLAIETSCDDTAVALLDRPSSNDLSVIANVRKTLKNADVGGIIPVDAVLHHQNNLAPTVSEVLQATNTVPDLIAVTRGPGMGACLAVGLECAKGLAVALNKPLIGVNHMLGHLLTCRIDQANYPQFPFVTLLASGGHTMFTLSRSLYHHQILLNTVDIAIGDALDKCARYLGFSGNMIAKEMEASLVQNFNPDWLQNESLLRLTGDLPMRNKPRRIGSVAFSFASMISKLSRTVSAAGIDPASFLEPQNQMQQLVLAHDVQNRAFDHVIERISTLLDSKSVPGLDSVKSFVASGGTISNMTFRQKLQQLPFSNHYFPPAELCTDNAVMIGWAAIEMFENSNIRTSLSVPPYRKWDISTLSSDPYYV
ncbi:hypothetical protein CANCADRAFT_14002, partial [Tortispora caseinolytica NRRL Y-17796]